ncbi:MAG TPA: DinB family protein [Ignavibacteriaceae bacterium]|nr:DinB family protein [Ignavibacteriaceae bacterium]
MGLRNTLLPEFDSETANTIKLFERIPDDKLSWKPHKKSMDFAGLATHLANIPTWTNFVINENNFDIAPNGEELPAKDPVKSVDEAIELFNKNVAAAREAIAGSLDDHLMKPWTLLSAGNNIFTMPRIGVIRSMIMNHLIHHRAQLGVYLRLNDIAVPGVYGPTADEK